MDQATFEGEELCGHERERGTDATLDRVVRVSSVGVPEVSQPLVPINLSDFASYAVEFV